MEDTINEMFMMLLIPLILFVIGCVLFIPITYGSMGKTSEKREETEMYVDVVDKYTKTGLVGKTPITRYFTQVKIKGNKTEYETQVTSNEYLQINIGDEVLCTVFSNNDKIIDVEFGKSNQK